jgi:hypothetical protein
MTTNDEPRELIFDPNTGQLVVMTKGHSVPGERQPEPASAEAQASAPGDGVSLEATSMAEEGFFGPPPESIAAAAVPWDLHNHIRELERWATANKQEAFYDAIAFWSLKVPALLAAASAGVWAHFELTTVSVIAGAMASVCVIVDGIHPRGMLRNTHLRAWRTRSHHASDENTAKRIMRDAEPERVRIAGYIRNAETALKPETRV